MQEAQALRRQVMVKDKEAAERATLVKQEKLQRHTNRSPLRLMDVWVFPTISQKRKTSGTLECHYNGFRCAPRARACGWQSSTLRGPTRLPPHDSGGCSWSCRPRVSARGLHVAAVSVGHAYVVHAYVHAPRREPRACCATPEMCTCMQRTEQVMPKHTSRSLMSIC